MGITLILSFAQIPGESYFLFSKDSVKRFSAWYYDANHKKKITQSNVNAFSVYCTLLNHLLYAEFFLYANMVLA